MTSVCVTTQARLQASTSGHVLDNVEVEGGGSHELPPLPRVHGLLPRVHGADHAGITIENNSSLLAGEYVRSCVA